MTWIVRPIEEQDISGFHEALDIVSRERKYLAFLEAPPFESTASFIRNNISEDHPQFVAVANGVIVGWCDVLPARPNTTHSHSGVLGIGIIPEFRGKGLGRELMKQTIAKAHAKGLTRIELTVREDNLNAVALYKKLGFVVEGTKRNGVRVDGVYENLLLMGLLS